MQLYSCYGVFTNITILERISLEWDSWSAMTGDKKLVDVTGPEVSFFHKRKGILKVDQSVNMPWHRLSIGVACSYLSAPGETPFLGSSNRQADLFWKMVWQLGNCLGNKVFHLELTLDSQALRHQLCLWINRDDFDSTGRKNSSCCVGKLTEENFIGAECG